MNKIILSLFFLVSILLSLHSQVDPYLTQDEIESSLDRALDTFSSGSYEEALAILNQVLEIDPFNSRAMDLIKSINALYQMEINSEPSEGSDREFITRRPDFNVSEQEKNVSDPVSDPLDEHERPDFSIRDDDSDLIHPKETRTKLDFSLYASLLEPWSLSEESVVFPSSGSLTGNLYGKVDYFFDGWDRIFGFSGMYSLFLLDVDDDGLASDQLHVIDAMINFRTFFREEVDTKIIFKLSMGYRGYFSNGYTFYSIDRYDLSGFNMGVNLEAPLLYYFWDYEFFKRLIFDFDMNLLFFPEINTLNLLDFRLNSELHFSNFSTGVHFGAYSVVTTDDVSYLWMAGVNLSLYL